ncbi:MAG TPA: hypothetical protein VJH71_02665 [Candidatus Paceibacterota bacterium]
MGKALGIARHGFLEVIPHVVLRRVTSQKGIEKALRKKYPESFKP